MKAKVFFAVRGVLHVHPLFAALTPHSIVIDTYKSYGEALLQYVDFSGLSRRCRMNLYHYPT